MIKLPPLPNRAQTFGEEVANAVSHGVGLLGSVAAVPVLVVVAVQRGGAADVVGASVFGGAMVALYAISTVYHALRPNRLKRLFRMLDHTAIFLMIAGTYTPFALGVLRGGWGWTLFGLVWGMALAGIALKLFGGLRFPVLSVGLYLAMGWIALVAIQPMMMHVPGPGLLWILAGGLAYTGGLVFYVLDQRIRYCHFVWHLFVMAGTACHFVAVLHYAS